MSAEQAVLRPTVIGSLLDIARHNLRARPGAPRDLRVGHRLPARRPARSPTSTTRSARCSSATRGPRAGATAARRRRTSTPRARSSRRCSARCTSTGTPSRRSGPSCIPGKAGVIRAGDAVLGIFGEVHPTVLATWEIDAPAAFLAIDVGKAVAAAPGEATYDDLTTFPELRQDLAVIVADDVTADRVLAVVRDGGRAADRRRRRVRRLPRRAGGGGPRLARAAPGLPRGRPHARPTRTSRRCASRSSRALERELGGELRG